MDDTGGLSVRRSFGVHPKQLFGPFSTRLIRCPCEVGLRGSLTLSPILCIELCQVRVMDHQQVLGIAILRSAGEVEAAGDHDLAIDHDDLVMRDRDSRIDPHRNAGICEIAGRGVARSAPLFAGRGLVDNDPYIDSTGMCSLERGEDRDRGEAVCLNPDRGSGLADLRDNQAGAVLAGGEADLPSRWLPGHRRKAQQRSGASQGDDEAVCHTPL